MNAIFDGQLTLQSVNLLNKIVEPFQESCVSQFGPKAGDCITRKPAALVAGVQDLEIAAFDFDDQPQFLGKLKLVSIVFRSAVDKIADTDWTGLHP